MYKPGLILLGSLIATLVFAAEVNETLDADPNGRVRVSNVSGSVDVYGWDQNQVSVVGTLGDDVEDFIFETNGKQTTIRVKAPERHRGHHDSSAELTIRVPRGSSLDISTVSADIEVEGVRGAQELQSVSGDVETEIFGADLEVETVSGDIDIEGDGGSGEIEIESVSGDINANGVAGDVEAGAVSGDVEVSGGIFSNAEFETVNGDIDFAGQLDDGGEVAVETVNGDVEIQFAGAVDAEVSIETFNGRIRNCFGPEPQRTSKYAPGWELQFTEGSGNGRIRVETLNGGLRLCKD